MPLRPSSCAFFALVFLASSAAGNNNLFLPGDAFFPTVLTADAVARLDRDGGAPPIFEYNSLGGYDAAFCGYAGYQRAAILSVDAPFIANLKLAYARLRQFENKQLIEISTDGETRLVETNGMRVLFYPQQFAFPRYKLGLRYNERWVDEVLKFGHPRSHIGLCSLIDDADAVMQSWRDAELVGPLNASLPDVDLKPVPETIEPVTIAEPVQAFILHPGPLASYYRPTEDDMMTLSIVDSSGIKELRYEDGSWSDVAEND